MGTPDDDAPPTTVVVGESNAVIRIGLTAALGRASGVDTVGEAEDLDALVDAVGECEPDVAVAAYDLSGLDAHEDLTAPLRDVQSDLKVVVVSDDTTDTAIMRTFRSAADGFLVKDNAPELLELAVASVVACGTFIDPQVARILVALTSKGHRSYDGPFGMTVQEQRVAVLLADGLTNKQIARQLGITAGTVKTHVANVVDKLDAEDRYDAADIVEREHIRELGM